MFSFLRCSSVKDRGAAPPLLALAVVGPEGTVGAWRLFIFLLSLRSTVGPEPRERVLCRRWHSLISEATRKGRRGQSVSRHYAFGREVAPKRSGCCVCTIVGYEGVGSRYAGVQRYLRSRYVLCTYLDSPFFFFFFLLEKQFSRSPHAKLPTCRPNTYVLLCIRRIK